MSTGLFALLKDVSVIAKTAAASKFFRPYLKSARDDKWLKILFV